MNARGEEDIQRRKLWPQLCQKNSNLKKDGKLRKEHERQERKGRDNESIQKRKRE